MKRLLVLFLVLTGLLQACGGAGSEPETDDAVVDSEKALFSHEEGTSEYIDLFDEAIRLLDVGEIAAAEAIYNEIITLEPNNPLGYVGLGTCDLLRSDYSAAEAHYQVALGLDSNSTGALTGLGSVAYELGEYTQAIDWYGRVIELNPNLPDAYYGLGISHEAAGNEPLAIQHYQAFLELVPDSPLADAVRESIDLLQNRNS